MKTIVASGYFDPLHVGHIEYLNKAAFLGERLIVIVNNDKQCVLKKGKPFQSESDRLTIIRNLKCVYRAFLSSDEDGTVCQSIKDTHSAFKIAIFAKGGDRYSTEIPEAAICKELGIEIVDGLGEKIRSSSELIKGINDGA
jgi:cytidyltransferase-like protein